MICMIIDIGISFNLISNFYIDYNIILFLVLEDFKKS